MIACVKASTARKCGASTCRPCRTESFREYFNRHMHQSSKTNTHPRQFEVVADDVMAVFHEEEKCSVAKACAKDSLNYTISTFGYILNQALVDTQHLVFDRAVACSCAVWCKQCNNKQVRGTSSRNATCQMNTTCRCSHGVRVLEFGADGLLILMGFCRTQKVEALRFEKSSGRSRVQTQLEYRDAQKG